MLFGSAAAAPARVEADPAKIALLKSLSVEQLLEIEITTASRRIERLTESASAVQVLGPNDIRRSGAVTLPQVLRLAPNLHVARSGASSWGITARGFNDTTNTNNKLLVMIDGRSVYSPLFSGTFWDTQDVFLPDVERIEVVSGPGGATWGANAVNGVVNVLTKHARDTQGTLVYAGGGAEARAFGGVRYGGRAGTDTFFRVYAKHLQLDDSVRPSGANANDGWWLSQAGFRVDRLLPGASQLTLQGDTYEGEYDQPSASAAKLDGGNLLARYQHVLADGSELELVGYFDRAHRRVPGSFRDLLDTWNIDLQHHVALGDRHDVVWGAGYRNWHDEIDNPPQFALLPAETTEHLISAFAQDEISLSEDRLRLTAGAKYEYNSYSGSELQPSVRLAWLARPRHLWWAAVSRAVRTPSRVDRDFYLPAEPPHSFLAGGPDFRAESLWAYELGWRGSVSERVSWSLTGFYHDYDDLRSIEGPPPFVIANGVEGQTYGSELVLNHEPTDWFRWSLGYTWLHRDIHPETGSRDLNQGMAESADPRHQVLWRTSFDLPGSWEIDLDARHVSQLRVRAGGQLSEIPAYTELSARIGWWVRDNFELSVAGRNLLHDQHLELGSATNRREIERSVHAKAVWQF